MKWSLYKVGKIFFTINLHVHFIPMIYLIVGSLYLLIAFPSGNHQFSLSESLFLFCLFLCFVFQIPHKSEIIWYLLFFSNISLSIIPPRSVCVAINGKISFFFMAKWYSCERVCVCVCICVWMCVYIYQFISHFLYPFISGWILGLLTYLQCCEWCYNKHGAH